MLEDSDLTLEPAGTLELTDEEPKPPPAPEPTQVTPSPKSTKKTTPAVPKGPFITPPPKPKAKAPPKEPLGRGVARKLDFDYDDDDDDVPSPGPRPKKPTLVQRPGGQVVTMSQNPNPRDPRQPDELVTMSQNQSQLLLPRPSPLGFVPLPSKEQLRPSTPGPDATEEDLAYYEINKEIVAQDQIYMNGAGFHPPSQSVNSIAVETLFDQFGATDLKYDCLAAPRKNF